MTDRSDTDYDVAHLPDDEDAIYLIGVDDRTSDRMLNTIGERFEALFNNARYIMVRGGVDGAEGVKTWALDSDEVKDAIEEFKDADDEGEQMVAINRMLPEEDKLDG